MKLKIFVISLARAAKRRADISARLKTAGVEFEIVDAVDGKTLDEKEYRHRLINDLYYCPQATDLSPSEIGCFLSHYNLWKRIVAEKIPFALVLEYDAVWSDDFFNICEAVVASKYYWNAVHLAGRKPVKVLSEIESYGQRQLIRAKRVGQTTVAYLIDYDGAVKFIKLNYEIRAQIDHQWINYWRGGVYFYRINPPPVQQSDAAPTIEHFDTKMSWSARRLHINKQVGAINYFLHQKGNLLARKFFNLTHPRKLRK